MIVYTDKHKIPFQIDDADYDVVSRYSWAIAVHGYPVTRIGKRPTSRILKLHQFLFGHAPDGLEWDHINRDKSDNQRGNLRLVTRQINVRNTGLSTRNSSGVKGVQWMGNLGKWMARIKHGDRTHYLGVFATITEAALVRRDAEARLWTA